MHYIFTIVVEGAVTWDRFELRTENKKNKTQKKLNFAF